MFKKSPMTLYEYAKSKEFDFGHEWEKKHRES